MTNKEIISEAISFVQKELKHAEGGHDWWHIHRVHTMAKKICETEKADPFIVEMAALLHDIADSKFYNGDEEIGAIKAGCFLKTLPIKPCDTEHILNILKNISFKGGNFKQAFHSPELNVVQDADRLDAMGAIGIARTFNYGGFTHRKLYDPEIAPVLNMSKEEYKKSTAPTINHFYEKLLLLKERMNTETAKIIARQRHEFMLQYLDQFFKEWNGEK